MRKTPIYIPMELIGNLKSYEWGKLGPASKVAQLAKLNDPQFQIQSAQPYAELWMGAHVSGPSSLKSTRQSLADVVQLEPSLISGHLTLPFLFKVLSINKALSIQVHPNQTQAQSLHAKYPDIYKDPNHKPELAIALTPFMALCGFRPKEEIYKNLTETPELVELLDQECIDTVLSNEATGIKECFSKLMLSCPDNVIECIRKIAERFKNEQCDNDIPTIFLRLQNEFPDDIGTLCLFFLNILKLEPGQAIFLGANEIHAYLDGDCMECMACSDNVIRAGLTPKFKDVPTLLKMLNFTGAPSSSKLFKPVQHLKLKYTKIYSPPVKDFAIAEINVPGTEKCYTIENRTCGSIFIVLSGTGTITVKDKLVELVSGSIIFLPAVTGDQAIEDIQLEITSKDNFVAYQAMYNDF